MTCMEKSNYWAPHATQRVCIGLEGSCFMNVLVCGEFGNLGIRNKDVHGEMILYVLMVDVCGKMGT